MSEREMFEHAMEKLIVTAPPGQPINFDSREMRLAWAGWKAARAAPDGWRMRVAGIAAECADPDAQAALDKLLEETP